MDVLPELVGPQTMRKFCLAFFFFPVEATCTLSLANAAFFLVPPATAFCPENMASSCVKAKAAVKNRSACEMK